MLLRSRPSKIYRSPIRRNMTKGFARNQGRPLSTGKRRCGAELPNCRLFQFVPTLVEISIEILNIVASQHEPLPTFKLCKFAHRLFPKRVQAPRARLLTQQHRVLTSYRNHVAADAMNVSRTHSAESPHPSGNVACDSSGPSLRSVEDANDVDDVVAHGVDHDRMARAKAPVPVCQPSSPAVRDVGTTTASRAPRRWTESGAARDLAHG